LELFSFTNFITEQFSLRVGKVDDSILLSDQLQIHKNEILVRIMPYALKMIYNNFNYRSAIAPAKMKVQVSTAEKCGAMDGMVSPIEEKTKY
jgi:hypothetical protein